MTFSPASIFEAVETSRGKALCVVVAAIFCLHLAWGVWFVTASPTNMPKTSLRTQGDEYLKSYPTWDTDYESDGAFHNRAAVGVMETGIPRTRSGAFCDHSPIYAYFLAICYKAGGIRLLSVAIPQAILSAGLGMMLGLTAAQFVNARAKSIAALSTALLLLGHLILAGYVAYPSPTLLLMFTFAMAMLAASRSSIWWFTVAMAVGIFTHAAFFVVGGAAGLWLLIRFVRSRERSYLGFAFVLLVVAGLKLGLGMIDTASNQEDHLRKEAQGMIWQGNNPYYEDIPWWGLWEQRIGSPTASSRWQKTPAQEQRFQNYLQRAGGSSRDAGWLWIRENPGQYAKLCVVRLRTELGPFTANTTLIRRIICTVIWLLIFPAGIYGLWRARGSAFSLLAILTIAAVVLFDSLVFVNFRYRLPAELMLAVFAGQTYAGWLQSWLGLGAIESRLREAAPVLAESRPKAG